MVCNLLIIRQLIGEIMAYVVQRQDSLLKAKPNKAGWLAVALVLGWSAIGGQAQEASTNAAPAKPVQLQASDNGKGNDNGNNGKAKGKSKPKVAERPQVIGSQGSSGSGEKGKPDRPGNPNATDPVEVTSQITRFQSAREEFLAAQKELNLKKKDATEEQRAVLREKVREALEKWKEEHKQFAEEQKERSKEMKLELQPDLGKVVDGAGGDGGKGRDR
jgi:flagellar motility protein MotE (MotC chaperone)